MSPSIVSVQPARGSASTASDIRGDRRPRPGETTVVESAPSDQLWSVRVEIVASQRLQTAAVTPAQYVVNGNSELEPTPGPHNEAAIVDEPSLLASAETPSDASLSSAARFTAPNLRRAVAAYGKLAFDASAPLQRVGQRISIRS